MSRRIDRYAHYTIALLPRDVVKWRELRRRLRLSPSAVIASLIRRELRRIDAIRAAAWSRLEEKDKKTAILFRTNAARRERG